MQNSRRDFLRNTALAGMAMSIPFKKELFAMTPAGKPFGIQLWTVKEALAKDPLAVLKHLSRSPNDANLFKSKNCASAIPIS
jgi:hypothetical protein